MALGGAAAFACSTTHLVQHMAVTLTPGRTIMGIFDGIMGNASATDVNAVAKELAPLLTDGEEVQMAYKLVRDLYVFTNKRIMFVDKQGMTGKKVEWLSIPYRAIARFSLETAGTFDMDAELKIWVSGGGGPIEKRLSRGAPVAAIARGLATYVL